MSSTMMPLCCEGIAVAGSVGGCFLVRLLSNNWCTCAPRRKNKIPAFCTTRFQLSASGSVPHARCKPYSNSNSMLVSQQDYRFQLMWAVADILLLCRYDSLRKVVAVPFSNTCIILEKSEMVEIRVDFFFFKFHEDSKFEARIGRRALPSSVLVLHGEHNELWQTSRGRDNRLQAYIFSTAQNIGCTRKLEAYIVREAC